MLGFEWRGTKLKRDAQGGRVACLPGDVGGGKVLLGKGRRARYVAKTATLETIAQVSRPAWSCPNTMSIVYVYSHARMPDGWIPTNTEKAPPDPVDVNKMGF